MEGGTRGKTRRGGENARERSFLPYGCPPWLFSRIKNERGQPRARGSVRASLSRLPLDPMGVPLGLSYGYKKNEENESKGVFKQRAQLAPLVIFAL